MSQGAKILVVEDEPHIRRLLRATMQRAGHEVIEAEDARQAIARLDIERPDIVLLDLGLPDRDGLELIGAIRLRSAAIVIVVSARDDGAEKVAALDLGADDYVTKPFDTDELLARIRTALRHVRTAAGDEHVGPVEAGAVRIDLEHRRVFKDGREVHLTPKEYAVLAELARRPDRVLSHAQLLKSVWGPAQVDRVEYLRIAVRGLRQKLEADPARPKLIINEMAVGYRLRA
jgi:two-component system KDP operon response regulator KdpE